MLNTTDVRLLKDQDIPSCDGIIGGPPCQAWSEGGKQLGFEDPRGQLLLEYIRIVNLKSQSSLSLKMCREYLKTNTSNR